jgi:hypothetical protein
MIHASSPLQNTRRKFFKSLSISSASGGQVKMNSIDALFPSMDNVGRGDNLMIRFIECSIILQPRKTAYIDDQKLFLHDPKSGRELEVVLILKK